jgi:hypothetical protein
MKHVIQIDRATGDVTVEANALLGVMIHIEIGSLTISFGMASDHARRLGEALVGAADEMDRTAER